MRFVRVQAWGLNAIQNHRRPLPLDGLWPVDAPPPSSNTLLGSNRAMQRLGRAAPQCQAHAAPRMQPLQAPLHRPRRQVTRHASPPASGLRPDILGYWIKDAAASDPMDAAMSLAQLNPLMRQAVQLIRALAIKQEGQQGGQGECFVLEVISLVSWLKVVERYPLDGGKAALLRRDLRLGTMIGSFSQGPEGEVRLLMEWGDPVGGVGTDVFLLPSPDVLQVVSTVNIGGREERFRSLYNRQRG